MAAASFPSCTLLLCYGRALSGGTGWQILQVNFHSILKAAAVHFKSTLLFQHWWVLLSALHLFLFHSQGCQWHFYLRSAWILCQWWCVNLRTNKHKLVVNKFRMEIADPLAAGEQLSRNSFVKRLADQETKWFQYDLPKKWSWLPAGARSWIQLPLEVPFSPLVLIKQDFALFS